MSHQRYKVPITIAPLEDGSYMARCEVLRATATGDTSEEAAVFQNIDVNTDIQIFEYAA